MKYEPVPQVTPSLPPATLPKPSPEGKPQNPFVSIICVHCQRRKSHNVLSYVIHSQASCPRGHCPEQLPASQEFP